MFRRLMMFAIVAVATSSLANAAGFIGFVGGIGNGGGGGGGGYSYSGYHNSYYHYSAPSYAAPQVTYQRVPIYVIRKKPAVKTVRVIHVHQQAPPQPVCHETYTPAPVYTPAPACNACQ